MADTAVSTETQIVSITETAASEVKNYWLKSRTKTVCVLKFAVADARACLMV